MRRSSPGGNKPVVSWEAGEFTYRTHRAGEGRIMKEKWREVLWTESTLYTKGSKSARLKP